MALVDLAAVAAALSQSFAPRLARQANRSAVLMSLLPKVVGAGKNCAWDVEFDGATAATYNDGADASAFDSDISVPATLDWGRFRSNFSVSGLAISAAQTSQSPEELLNIIEAKLEGSASKLLSVMNLALFAGTAAPSFVGLGTSVDSSGDYASVAIGTYPSWAATERANGGTPRELTKALIDDLERSVYEASGKSPNCYVTTPLLAQRFKGLFDPSMKFSGAPGDISAISALASVLGDSTLIPPVLASNFVGFYEGRPVFRDKDCTAGVFYGLNTEELEVAVLPQPTVNTSTMVMSKDLRGNVGDRLSGVIARVEALGKTGDAEKMTVKCYAQLKVKSRNAQGKITDLPTS